MIATGTHGAAHAQTLPTLVQHAIAFSLDPRVRSVFGTMVTNLHNYSHIKGTSGSATGTSLINITGANKVCAFARARARESRCISPDAR